MPVWTAWSSRWTARWPEPSWPSATCSATRPSPPMRRAPRRGSPARGCPSRSCRRSSPPCGARAPGADQRALAVVVADDDAAMALAESAAAFLPPDTAAFLPSRGVGWGSGLDPAPHLVGERHRGLHALARGGLVAVSADALIERIEPAARRPAPVALRLGRGAAVRRPRPLARRRRLRALRGGRGARPVLGARRPGRRVPDDRPRAGAGGVLRRPGRAALGLLGVHPALAARPLRRPDPPGR